jgi:DNA-binding beta-propeller fold protein YncE
MKTKLPISKFFVFAVILTTSLSSLGYCNAQSPPNLLRAIPENTITLHSPWGVATDTNSEYLYITDTNNNRIIQLSMRGEGITASWGGLGDNEGSFDTPKGIILDNVGSVYIVDSGNDRIQKFNHNGSEFILDWGETGTGNGQLIIQQV